MPATDLTGFQKELGWFFRDESFLRMALTHPSVVIEAATGQQHNQRLEFLGDAVLQLVLTRELYDRFPELSEGHLTKARARLVKRRTLADLGARLHIGQYLVLSRGEELQGGRERPSALADAFEALLGAIFLDGGFEPVREFVLRHFHQDLAVFTAGVDTENPKGELQELLQA
jgi:ribonuclease-3